MKKLRVLLLCAVVALAAVGFAACGGEKEEYTVAFETAGGGTLATQTVKAGEKAQKPADPSKTGWTFTGWELDGAAYTFTEPVNANITLVAKYASVLGGAGTVIDPITIDTAAEWTQLGELLASGAPDYATSIYKQTANIASTLTAPIASFAGSYDGGGYTIETTQPLFTELSGRVENLTIRGDLSGGDRLALLALTANNAHIIHCTASGSLNTIRGVAGGLVAVQNGGRIEYGTVDVAVGAHMAGGIAGESSGAIVNCAASGEITADENGGGIAGLLRKDGLIQNCGFGGSVRSTSAAGGIAGCKEAGSAIYRGFTYGGEDDLIAGAYAGGIVGRIIFDLSYYEDTLDCAVHNDVRIIVTNTQRTKTICEGETEETSFADLGLPSAVWNTSASIPVLKTVSDALPITVNVRVGETTNAAPYGGHIADADLFAGTIHFSVLNELDADVQLQTVAVSVDAMTGVFADATAELTFAGDGKSAVYSTDGETNITLTHTRSRLNTLNAGNTSYAANVHFYTGGGKEYAFIIEKESTDAGYIGYLHMFARNNDAWTLQQSWSPKTDAFGGAYTLSSRYIVIDSEYTVETVESDNGTQQVGFNLIKFYMQIPGSDPMLEYFSRGITVMNFGWNINATEYSTALAFAVSSESMDYIWWNASGKLESAAFSDGYDFYEPTDAPFTGEWFDGTARYTVNAQDRTVQKETETPVSYTFVAEENCIAFTIGNENYKLSLGVNAFGDYRLHDLNGQSFIGVAYVDDYLTGEWKAGDMLIKIQNSPATSVSVNGTPASGVNKAVYNNAQAVRFAVGGTEYYLVRYSGDGLAVLYSENTQTFAIESNVYVENYVGTFATVTNGHRIQVQLKEDYTTEYTVDGTKKTSGSVVMAYNPTLETFTLSFSADGSLRVCTFMDASTMLMLDMSDEDIMYLFTATEKLARFAVDNHTSGTEMLEIDENGQFVRYNRGGDKGTPVALSAEWLDNFGFVLAIKDSMGEITQFFRADAVGNIVYFQVDPDLPLGAGELIAFIPQERFNELPGRYVNYNADNNTTDTIEIKTDGTMSETYTSIIEQTVSSTWYPSIGYLEEGGDTFIILHILTQAGNMVGNATQTAVGLSFFGGDMMYYKAELYPATREVYKENDTNSTLRIFETSLWVDSEEYKILSVAENGGAITLSLKSTAIPLPPLPPLGRSVSRAGDEITVTFTENSGHYTAMLTENNQTRTFAGETKLSYKNIAGTYASNKAVYTFEEVTLPMPGARLEFTENGTLYTFMYKDSVFTASGVQTLRMTYLPTYGPEITKYVRKDGNNLIVSSTLDETAADTAAPYTALDKSALAKQTFKHAQDTLKFTYSMFANTVTVTLTGSDGDPVTWAALYNEYSDGDTYVMEFRKSTLPFETETLKVRLSIVNNAVVSVAVGKNDAAVEDYVVYENYADPSVLDTDKLKALQFADNGAPALHFYDYSGLYIAIGNDTWSVLASSKYENGTHKLVFESDGVFDAEGTKYVTVAYDANGAVASVTVSDTEDGAGTVYTPVAA